MAIMYRNAVKFKCLYYNGHNGPAETLLLALHRRKRKIEDMSKVPHKLTEEEP